MRESSVRHGSVFSASSALGLALLLFLGAVASPAASMPPRYKFKTLRSDRVSVHFHAEVEAPARRAMALILEVLPRLEARYRVTVPSLDVVVHDANDSPNGLATSFPYPYVQIRTASDDGADTGPTESWLRLVITHELTHIVHIEQAGGIYGFGRRVFGRAPFLFPNALQPSWFIEGLAVREETRGTAMGRGRHALTRMVVDEAALSGQLRRIDQANLSLDVWPLGNAAYLFGEEFLSFVEKRFGAEATRDIALSHGRSFRPYLDSRSFRKTTGRSLVSLWTEFADERAAALRADPTRRPGPLTLLSDRGTVQTAPRLSPDGSLIAYSSRTLNRLGEIRLMRKDGSSDRRLATRVSGSELSWSRDGAFIVFHETNQVRKFESQEDLYRVEIVNGKRTRLTVGLRASDPDVGPSPPGERPPIVFVQRLPDRTELGVLVEGGRPRVLTASAPGAEWSHPRFSPRGDAIVASRLQDGYSDLVSVDPETGSLRPLTQDRAVDAEPSWVDDQTIVFRSDRVAGAFRLFLIRRDGSDLRMVADSPRNAFAPEVDVPTGTIFYAHYSDRGFDLARAPFAPGDAVREYVDPFPVAVAEPPPFEGAALPYRPLGSLRPRFASPYVELVSDEWRPGLATVAFDPLLRTAYGLAASWGTKVSKPNLLGYARYDRFTPTFTALARRESSPAQSATRDLTEGRLTIDFPLERAVLRSQTLGLTVRRRHESVASDALDTGVLSVGWILDSTRRYPMSISPQDGVRLRLAASREMKALGSDLDFGKLIVDARAYSRLGRTVLASRLGGGWTFGPRVPRRAYSVGGLASPALLDPVGDEPAVLRGYKTPDRADATRSGKKVVFGNLEMRIPLGHPQTGLRALPFFLRHLHLTASLDAAVVGSGDLNLSSARVGASVGLGADILLGHRVPLTIQGGVGQGLTRDGGTVPWFSIGFPF